MFTCTISLIHLKGLRSVIRVKCRQQLFRLQISLRLGNQLILSTKISQLTHYYSIMESIDICTTYYYQYQIIIAKFCPLFMVYCHGYCLGFSSWNNNTHVMFYMSITVLLFTHAFILCHSWYKRPDFTNLDHLLSEKINIQLNSCLFSLAISIV